MRIRVQKTITSMLSWTNSEPFKRATTNNNSMSQIESKSLLRICFPTRKVNGNYQRNWMQMFLKPKRKFMMKCNKNMLKIKPKWMKAEEIIEAKEMMVILRTTEMIVEIKTIEMAAKSNIWRRIPHNTKSNRRDQKETMAMKEKNVIKPKEKITDRIRNQRIDSKNQKLKLVRLKMLKCKKNWNRILIISFFSRKIKLMLMRLKKKKKLKKICMIFKFMHKWKQIMEKQREKWSGAF